MGASEVAGELGTVSISVEAAEVCWKYYVHNARTKNVMRRSYADHFVSLRVKVFFLEGFLIA